MTRRRRRALALLLLSPLLLVAILLLVLHLPPVQRSLFARLSGFIEQRTGWEIEVETIQFTLLPAHLDATGVRITGPGVAAALARAERVTASWGWGDVLRAPRRIDEVEVTGLELDLDNLPPPSPEQPDEQGDPLAWLAELEIGRLDARASELDFTPPAVAVRLRELRLGGRLVDARAGVRLGVGSLALTREGRELPLGPATADVVLTRDGLRVDPLVIDGERVVLRADGTLAPIGEDQLLDADFTLELRLAGLLEWWDPALARAETRGVISGRGTLRWSEATGLELQARASGDGVVVAGYPVATLELRTPRGEPVVYAADPSWGAIEIGPIGEQAIPFEARLETLPLEQARVFLPPAVAARLPAGAVVSGRVTGSIRLPFDAGSVRASVEDLVVDWPGGRLALGGAVEGREVQLRQARLELPGGQAEVTGSLEIGRRLDLEAEVTASEPARLLDALDRYLPALPEGLEISGGEARLTGTARGAWDDPVVDARLAWQRPIVAGRRADELQVSLEGRLSDVDWRLRLDAGGGALVAEGQADLLAPRIAGDWVAQAVPAEVIAAFIAPEEPPELRGVADVDGEFAYAPEQWSVSGRVNWAEPGFRTHTADLLRASLVASSDRVVVESLRLVRGDAAVEAAGRVSPLSKDADVDAEIAWSAIAPSAFLPEGTIPDAFEGAVSGSVNISGSLPAPVMSGRALWEPASEELPLGPVVLSVETQDGEVVAVTEQLGTAAGPAVVYARAPLGGLPLPDWLYPGAPDGPIRLGADAPFLDLTPILAGLGIAAPGVAIHTGLKVEGAWSLTSDQPRTLHAELPDLALITEDARLTAVAPPVVELRGGTLVLEPMEMEGAGSTLEARATFGIEERRLDARLAASLDSALLRLAAPELEFEGPIQVRGSAEGALAELTGRLEVDHDGEIAIADPPVQIKALHLQASFAGGAMTIEDGSALVNDGQVLLAGGWNPEIEQGIVAQADNVSFIVEPGILTRWDGLIAFEPRPGSTFAVVGDLTLDRGLWDRDLDLTGLALEQFGGADAPAQVGGVGEDIALDLEVTTRTAFHVDNNLGALDLRWQRLYVRGSAARPEIEGTITMMPDSRLLLGGREVTIVRGEIDFSGVPGAAPQVEIVSEGNLTGGGSNIPLQTMAQVGALKAVGGAVGLSNTDLEPISIATETGSNPGTDYTIARVLGDNAILFLTTDLTNAQERTGLLQLWNFRRFPGTAAQVFSSTEEGDGAAILQRMRFGGTVAEEDQPEVDEVELKGDWPVSKRRVRKAIGFGRGQVYDPFMVFVGEVRAERELAQAGYYEAEVEGRSTGDLDSPTLEYRVVEAGPRVTIEFTGDKVPKDVRQRMRELYRPEPLLDEAIEDIRGALRRELTELDYPLAAVDVRRRPAGLEVRVSKGFKLELTGLELEGVAEDVASSVEPLFGSAVPRAELARRDPLAINRLLGLLAREGYPGATVEDVELRRDDDVHEGRVHVRIGHRERITLEEVRLQGSDPLGALSEPEFPLKPGMPLRRQALDDAVLGLRRRYRNAGYPEVETRASIVEQDDRTWPAVVTLDPGGRRQVGDVQITGARYTSGDVIRAGVEAKPGEVLRVRDLDRTAANLALFPPIESVSVSREEAAGGDSIVQIALEERPRWEVGAGVRWKSETGEEYIVDLRDNNLFGRGLAASFRGHWGPQSWAGRLYGALPPLPGGRLGFDGWMSLAERETDRDTERTFSFTFQGRFRRSATTELRAYLRRDETTVTSLEGGPEVVATLGSVGGQLVVDRRHDPFMPTSGWYLALDTSYSPKFLDSDRQVLRTLGTYSTASSFGRRWTLAQALRLGYAHAIDGPLPPTRIARFFAGGESTIRGFQDDSVGPLDPTGDPLGGGALAVINEEVRFKVWGRVFAAGFADIGQVWRSWSEAGSDVSVGAGIGVRVVTPLGPLRGDVAWPVHNRQGNSGPRFYFGIGQVF